MTARTAPSRSSIPASMPLRPRSAAGSPRVQRLHRRPGQPGPGAGRQREHHHRWHRRQAAAAAAAPAATANIVLANTIDGHGTPVAGVIAQFVPQATIVPVDIFIPVQPAAATISSRHQSTTGGPAARRHRRRRHRGTGTGGTSAPTTDGATTQTLYNGPQYVIQHPYVNDPLRPGKVDRVIAAVFAFGTPHTFADRGRGLQAATPGRDRPQERLSQVPQGGHRQRRGHGRVRRAAAGSRRSSSTTTGGTGGTGDGTTDPPGRQQRQELAGRRRQRHVPARRSQRGDLGHRRLFLPVHPDALDVADRSRRPASSPTRSGPSCSSAPA